MMIVASGVRKSEYPRGCKAPGWVKRTSTASHGMGRGAGGLGKQKTENVVTRLCNPKHFTGTASTGHLPTVVDLENGAGVSKKRLPWFG